MLIAQCDFDNTITVGEVSAIVRDAFGPDSWDEMEEEYLQGRYSVEESNVRQFSLISAGRHEIEDVVRERTVVREGFLEFVSYCRRASVRLVVVSSGLDLYIRPVMEMLGLSDVEVHCAKGEVTPSGIRVSYADPAGAPLLTGFKDSYVPSLRRAGGAVVYLGDSLSDVGPARLADFVMAHGSLQELLRAEGVPFYPFDDFHDVRRHLDAVRERLARS